MHLQKSSQIRIMARAEAGETNSEEITVIDNFLPNDKALKKKTRSSALSKTLTRTLPPTVRMLGYGTCLFNEGTLKIK